MMRFAISVVLLLNASLALASEPSSEWQVSVGGALLAAPLFPGAQDMGLALVPDLRLRYGEHFFASLPEGVGVATRLSPSLRVGALVKWRFPRREAVSDSPFLLSGDSNALQGLGDVDGTWEPGAFVEFSGPAWRARLEARRGFGGHEGALIDAEAAWRQRLAGMEFATGPRLSWASTDFTQAYYGITPAQAEASGLPAYSPQRGLLSAGWSLSLRQPLDQHWQWHASFVYDRLLGDAADSPLVRERGSRDQPLLVLGLGYRF